MPTFKVDGIEYPMIEDDLSLDEAGWFYRIAGIGVEALADPSLGDATMKVKALICLGIARAKPETPHSEIEARIGAMKMSELEDVFAESDGEQSPPLSPSEIGEPNDDSGEPSRPASDDSPAEEGQAPTGTQDSDTSSGSVQTTSGSLRRVS